MAGHSRKYFFGGGVILFVILLFNFHKSGRPSLLYHTNSGHLQNRHQSMTQASTSKQRDRPSNDGKASVSRTKPAHYPQNGTSKSVDIPSSFDVHSFNSFCTNNSDLIAILPIYSATNNAKRRTVLRESLGKFCLARKCKIFFVVGLSKSSSDNERLGKEVNSERDILVVPKLDTYRDMNDKAVAMLKWIVDYCHRVPFVIHTIEDTYVNVDMFLHEMSQIRHQYFLYSLVYRNFRVPRNGSTRHSLPIEEYPYTYFPDYCSGAVYGFPTRVAGRLLSAIYDADYCWIEDVWLTGHVSVAAHVELVGSELPYLLSPKFDRQAHKPSDFLFIHQITAKHYYSFYEEN